MKKSVFADSNQFQRGCLLLRLAAFFLLFGYAAEQARANETIWGCLLYASNDGHPSNIPPRIGSYDKRLSEAFGYSRLHLLGEGQTVVKTTDQNWLIFGGDIKVQFTSLTKTEDGKFVVGLQLFQDEKQLIETHAKVSPNSPLFIRGPEWRDGKIIIVVMVAS